MGTNQSIVFTTKNYIMFFLSIVIMVIGVFVPGFAGLSQAAARTLFFTFAILLLLITETFNIAIVSLLMIVLQPILGLTESFAATVTNFNTPIFFFLISAFIIAGAVQESNLSKRLLKILLVKFGKSTRGAITAILLATAFLSAFIANLPALVLFYGISLNFLDMFEKPEDRKQTGKSLCIGLIYAALSGGVCTVVGNMNPMIASANLTAAGVNISFLQWMIVGVPAGVLLFPLMLFILFKIFPPVEIEAEKRQKFIDSIEVPQKMTVQERWVTIIILLMVVCWLLGAKFPVLNTMHVSICGATLMILPCFKIMKWETANRYISWPAILLTCAFVSLAAVFTTSGLTDWILGIMDSAIPADAGIVVILLILGVITVLTLLFISNGPALVTIFAAPVIGLANARGINPAYLMIPLSMFMAFTVLLPIDSISLITYASGTYEMKDELKAGIPFALLGIIVISLVTTGMMKIIGL